MWRVEGRSEDLYKMGGFYSKKGGTGGSLAKKRIIFKPEHLILWGNGKASILSCRLPLLPLRWVDGEGPSNRLP